MLLPFRLAGAAAIGLSVIAGGLSQRIGSLPLGGSDLAQIGLVLGITFVFVEVMEARHAGRENPPGDSSRRGGTRRHRRKLRRRNRRMRAMRMLETVAQRSEPPVGDLILRIDP